MRSLLPALVLLAGGCTTTRAITSAGSDVSIAAQHITSTIDAVKQIATTIESHVEQPPTDEPPSPMDAILQAAVTVSPDLLAIYRAAKRAYEQIKATRQKAETAPAIAAPDAVAP